MNPDSISQAKTSRSHFAVWKALIAGWLMVNVPVIVIMMGVLLIGVAIEPKIWWLFLSIGFFLGWTWWSYMIPRWRRWALRRGAAPAKLQRWAVITGLVWRKGSVFEKTEISVDDYPPYLPGSPTSAWSGLAMSGLLC